MNHLNIVGVQFRRAGKVYDFHGGDYTLRVGDSVVVESDRGPALAQVARLRFVPQKQFKDGALKKILRVASKKDLDTEGRLSPEYARKVAAEKVANLKLDMRIMKAEVQFSGNKTIIYFTAPGRVDFRELVKDLAGSLKARVELKQVGARDEAKLIGGVGVCGREFCCSSFLREFVPVSIKMAKNQNLALNPTKISGGCGRLLCCLTYEDEVYAEIRKILPKRGARVQLDDGSYGDVIKADFLNQMVQIELESGQQVVAKANTIAVVAKDKGVEDDNWADDIDLNALDGGGSGGSASAKPQAGKPAREGEKRQDAARGDQNKQPRGEQGGGDPSSRNQKSRGRNRNRNRNNKPKK